MSTSPSLTCCRAPRPHSRQPRRPASTAPWRRGLVGSLGVLGVVALALTAATTGTAAATTGRTNAVLQSAEGPVRVAPAKIGPDTWTNAIAGQTLFPRDRVRTLDRARAVVQLSDLSTWRLGPNTIVQLPEDRDRKSGFQLLRGLLYYFHRDEPGTLPVRTPSAYAVILGTEFAVTVEPDGGTRFDLIDGRIELTNAFGALTLTNGQAARVAPNRPPERTPLLLGNAPIQWVLHYPAVIDPGDLRLTADETNAWAASLFAYRQGDPLAAVAAMPAPPDAAAAPASGSADVRLLRAAFELSAGGVTEAEAELRRIQTSALAGVGPGPAPTPSARNAESLRIATLVRALQTWVSVVRDPGTPPRRATVPHERGAAGPHPADGEAADGSPRSATWALAESLRFQAAGNLEGARRLARSATALAPEFGPAWARLAELEFGFGNIPAATAALDQAERRAPRHAHARALRGFLLASRQQIQPALNAFNDAIALDGSLGLAWLGRGLCRIRQGDRSGGRADLQVAATLEPQRALYRSYLGKAFAGGSVEENARAQHELALAQGLDPADPTAWLYAALLQRDLNRGNDAVRSLEQASEKNDGRAIHRSRLLLDTDAAVQGVNLAGLYTDAGLGDWSAREAGRAVQLDPASGPAHLFLGDAYQRQRDPGRVNQRFETPAVTEYLLAHLLSPIGAGTLAQSVTQNEYSRLFEADGAGLTSWTEYLSRGAWRQGGAAYGTMARSAFALSGEYRTDPGERANHDFEQHELSLQFQQDLTASDRLYLQVVQGTFESGDRRALQDPDLANRTLRVREEQEPLLVAGYHREWRPGLHTLALATWLSNDQEVDNGAQATLLRNLLPTGSNASYALPVSVEQAYHARLGLWSAELQQLWHANSSRHALIAGGRFQSGSIEVDNAAANPIVPDAPLLNGFATPDQHLDEEITRASLYGYGQLELSPQLLVVAGLAADWLRYPVNFRSAPLSAGTAESQSVSPKAGVLWTPSARSTLRAAYTQSSAGAAVEQSLRLEPTQVAGFNQSFRSVIPESVAGAIAGAGIETWAAAAEHRFETGTYVALDGEWLRSDADRRIGVYDYGAPSPAPPIAPSSTRERLAFEEQSVGAGVHQLLGADWAVGLRYRASHAQLQTHFRDLPDPPTTPGTVPARSDSQAWLHQIRFGVRYQHSAGFFALADTLWSHQDPGGDLAGAGDDCWQLDLQAGWRGWRRRIEIRIGLLNVTDAEPRLHPLNLTAELPRERTFMAACRLQF